MKQSPGSNQPGRVLHARQLDDQMHLPQERQRAGGTSEREAAVRLFLLKGLPGFSAGDAQVTGEKAALWHMAFGVPESGNCQTKSEPFTIPSWSVQPNVCPDR